MTNAHLISSGLQESQKADLRKWAIPQLRTLLGGLDNATLTETINYALSLPSAEAIAEHWQGFLGSDDPKALDFISGFGLRFGKLKADTAPPSANGTGNGDGKLDHVPASKKKGTARAPTRGLNQYRQPLRVVDSDGGASSGGESSGPKAYRKGVQEDFLSSKTPRSKPASGTSTPDKRRSRFADSLAVSEPSTLNGEASYAAATGGDSAPKTLPPSAQGTLTADALDDGHVPKAVRKPRKQQPSAKPTATLKFTGGKAMHAPGGKTAHQLSDIDRAIISLELQSQPSETAVDITDRSQATTAAEEDRRRRFCPCMAQRHPLLTAAPNCLSCGNIVCVKQGLGPCVSCGAALIKPEDVAAMLSVLRKERGREKMKSHNAANSSGPGRSAKGGSAAALPTSIAPTKNGLDVASSLSAAQEHKQKLLQYQTESVQRTTIRDEAADYDAFAGGAGTRWMDPRQRAMEVRRQERLLAEMEWNSRPEYEKRNVGMEVVGDGTGGFVGVRRMVDSERPDFEGLMGIGKALPEAGIGGNFDEFDEYGDALDASVEDGKGKGKESAKRELHANPLAKRLIKPTWHPPEGVKIKSEEERRAEREKRKNAWRRIQDDWEDTEARERDVLLDSGVEGAETGMSAASGLQPPQAGTRGDEMI